MTESDSSINDFMSQLHTMSTVKLCELIASNRYLGVMQDQAILAMTELANRRLNGDLFDYESYIDNLIKGLPSFKVDLAKIFKVKWGF